MKDFLERVRYKTIILEEDERGRAAGQVRMMFRGYRHVFCGRLGLNWIPGMRWTELLICTGNTLDPGFAHLWIFFITIIVYALSIDLYW